VVAAHAVSAGADEPKRRLGGHTRSARVPPSVGTHPRSHDLGVVHVGALAAAAGAGHDQVEEVEPELADSRPHPDQEVAGERVLFGLGGVEQLEVDHRLADLLVSTAILCLSAIWQHMSTGMSLNWPPRTGFPTAETRINFGSRRLKHVKILVPDGKNTYKFRFPTAKLLLKI
jgi:hypothetical protein